MTPEKEKKGPNKLIIVIIIMSIVMMAGATVMVFLVADISIADVMAKFEKHEEYVMPLETFTVNLTTEGKGSTYLKTQMSLLYLNEDEGTVLTGKTPQIRDIIIKDLMAYTSGELLLNGGLSTAKVKLKTSINTALGGEIVKEIYFTEFLVQ